MIYLWLVWMWTMASLSAPHDTRIIGHGCFDPDDFLIHGPPRHEPEVEAILKAKGLV